MAQDDQGGEEKPVNRTFLPGRGGWEGPQGGGAHGRVPAGLLQSECP